MPISDLLRGGTVILLDVRYVYIRNNFYKNGSIDQQLVDSIGKMGGDIFILNAKNIMLNRP
jgi:hypothetical protein|tara:strand:- start:1345 stop:1527 length:183 start_codon:yes stop_codon:yes gene_type:complete